MRIPERVSFLAGDAGLWQVVRQVAVAGEPLPEVAWIARVEAAEFAADDGCRWALHGIRSHDRYTLAAERRELQAVSPALGRAEAVCAALIPIAKSDAWWELPADDRRQIFEQRSQHIAIGKDYLPAVARRLYHCRDLGGPFDFLTWFEFAPEHEPAFDRLLARLREAEEWRHIVREVEIRLRRPTSNPHAPA